MRKEDKPQGRVFVITGPSGSGKTTLRDRLLKDKKLKAGLTKSISFTTRPQRPGEKDKRDYFFITQGRFRKNLEAQKILEWTRYLGYYYATPRDFIDGALKKGRNMILCLDLRGARKIKKFYPASSTVIFIRPPSLGELKTRITGRSKTAKIELRRRLAMAKRELQDASKYDYCVINENLARATRELKSIILKEAGIKK